MTVALGSMIPDADYLGDIVICVHGPSLAEDASAFEEAPVLGDRGSIILGIITLRIVAGIDVSLDPSVDVGIAGGAGEDRFTTDDTDESRDVSGPDVVEDDRGLESGGSPRTPVEDRGIPDYGVDDGDPTDAVNANLESDLCVVYSNSLAVPSPVPSHSDGGVRAIYRDVSDGKLLVADIEADVPSIDNEVAHKTTTGDPI